MSEKASKQFLKENEIFKANSFWEGAAEWMAELGYEIVEGACFYC